ncbi:beta-N-acetylglucosaminidase domain-containing protein [Streptomyces turgidiscabies]|uniref:O-GlcNAcase NagJ domain protein n=1 Tax=Streptomyces turgidiscabies (strain Car8) TaxID=698760 RepID=L7FCP4_STRT8|nr:MULTISPECIES: beta-N-acetylglucosaminidase domain-containing protein [Streptomyces]ELP69027.1 O-GlcNAcase NagJ domain protein [Streptomyces turgidiscabies Car8]MDX3492286.1 beta-N-acetylglucosaminidase domain-containing protein [Streptomyces turgidiscabies]GAQ69422.1 O-GlcNAcase precursor [Streptomyces turgidiscabies]
MTPALKSASGLLAALALCVLGTAPAPASAATPHSATTASVPHIWPTPQQSRPGHGTQPVPKQVVEVIGHATDPAARALVERVLRDAGARTIRTVTAGHPTPPAALTVYVGGPTENPATAKALKHLHAAPPTGLPSGGYTLATGKGTIALSGVDATGTFYAAQTLRQLITHGSVPSTTVRDWPTTALRGVIEGFYGAPWTQQDRLSQLDFYGRTKQNVYVYSPKDDPYLRANWRDDYPPAQLATLKQLVDRAAQNHVRFTYALSPGLSVCYSSAADVQALVAKFESLYAIGVRSFAVPLDDISYTAWNCPADEQKFGTGGGAAGTAQSTLLNSIVKDFVDAHTDVTPLEMVPTEYSDLADSPYKTALREKLDPSVVVEWTGVGVIAPTISTEQARQARELFGHPILIWDNYPVNDYTTSRLLLGPYTGREAGVATQVTGITANPMVQAEASKLALFTSASYAWNPKAYDPRAAFLASVRDFAANSPEHTATSLRVFAENNYSSLLDATESPTLTPLLKAFTTAYESGDGLGRAARALTAYFRTMAATPADLRTNLPNSRFLTETSAWLAKLGAYGEAGGTAVQLMLAQAKGDSDAVSTLYARLQSQRRQLDSVPQQIAPGVLDRFLFDATLRAAPDPGPDASFTPTSLSLPPGGTTTATLTITDDRSTTASTTTWSIKPVDGLTVTPSTGTVTVPAGGKATATVTFTAASGASAGTRSVAVTGEGLMSRAIPIQVTGVVGGSERALTANFSGASVSSVDLASGTSTEIPVGANPGEIVVSSDGRTAYAANQGSDTVSVIDVAAAKVTSTVAVGDVPAGLALTPDGRTLWVADYSDDAVQPIDTATGKAGSKIPVGDGPENMAITPDGTTLYVANIHDSTVSPVDIATGRAGTPIAVGPNPFNVVAAPDGRTVYVSNSGGSTITPIDTATNDTRPTFLVTGQAYGLAVSPDGRTLWVSASNGDTITPLDTVTGAPGTPVTVGRSAFDVTLDWNGTTAYVTTADTNTLIPVTTATKKAGTPLKTGAYPLAATVTGVPIS